MGQQEADGLGEIGQIAMTVRDLERAIEFYRDVLKLPFLFAVPNMAFFDCSGVRLMLGVPEADQDGQGSSILYFRVGEIQAAAHALAERGVEIKSKPHMVAQMEDHDLWMAFFDDSEGNTLALMSEVG